MTREAERLARARAMWRWTGDERPPFAEPTGRGQESVWDYPRPPRIEHDTREIVVSLAGTDIARTRRALRVLETASPPTFYLPRADLTPGLLQPAPGTSGCEWKGRAFYASIALPTGERLERCAWFYPEPTPSFEALRDHVAFYPQVLDCRIDGERVRPQPGEFYAGWITHELTGPFKGEPGSGGW